MNRWDEIKGAALDVAQHLTQDPARREAMAGDLITLVGLMINAVGKGVAVDGEADIRHCNASHNCNDAGCTIDREAELAHTRYLTGEALQSQADHVAEEARNADLLRYDRPVWHPRCAECGTRNGHSLDRNGGRCPEDSDDFCCDQPYGLDCKSAPVQRCGECNRAEGDSHVRGCRLAGCVAVHLSHDLDLCICGDEGCDWGSKSNL